MKLLITDNHEGEGEFPTFPKGTHVKDIESSEESLHWLACTINDMKTYIPGIFLENEKLVADYNPTELSLAKDDIVDLEKVVYEWLYVKKADGIGGWFPANKVISISE